MEFILIVKRDQTLHLYNTDVLDVSNDGYVIVHRNYGHCQSMNEYISCGNKSFVIGFTINRIFIDLIQQLDKFYNEIRSI